MGKAQPGNAYLISGQRVEHKGVVGVRTMRNADLANLRVTTRHVLYLNCRAFRGRTSDTHACSLREYFQPVKAAAANITLMISAKTNQYNPKRTACAKEWVRTASHEMPTVNSSTSASKPAAQARAKDALPRSMIQPARAATNG